MKRLLTLSFALCILASTAPAWAHIRLAKIGSYASPAGESAAEICAYDQTTRRMFVVNGAEKAVDVISVDKPPYRKLFSISVAAHGRAANSVAVKNGLVAVAVEAEPRQAAGKIILFDTDGRFLRAFEAGALPDMVTFSPNGRYILAANEGEPSKDYSVDPEASVTVIDLDRGLDRAQARSIDFRAFDAAKAELVRKGVRISHPRARVSQDLEPEYIAVSPDSSRAFVSLQENNAVAILDLQTMSIVDIAPLGSKTWSKMAMDASDKDGGVNRKPWPVWGTYMPDSLAAYAVGNRTYVIAANEGDSREYDGYEDETRVAKVALDPAAFPDGDALKDAKNLGRLKIIKDLGDADGDGDYDSLHAFGARSFSILDEQGRVVYDSGDDFERILAERHPGLFNSGSEKVSPDDRSDDKGAEPEGAAVGEVDGRVYAFIGLERTGGVMLYEVTDPLRPAFVDYVPGRSENPAAKDLGDLAPEGVHFVPASDSHTGRPLLIVGNEVSGTMSIYEILPR